MGGKPGALVARGGRGRSLAEYIRSAVELVAQADPDDERAREQLRALMETPGQDPSLRLMAAKALGDMAHRSREHALKLVGAGLAGDPDVIDGELADEETADLESQAIRLIHGGG